MDKPLDLREYVPDACTDLLDKSDNELKSVIPELARDKDRMGEIEKAVKQLPLHHQLYQADSHDLSMVDDESVHLAATSPPYFNLKDYNIENGGGSDGQLGDINDYEEWIIQTLLRMWGIRSWSLIRLHYKRMTGSTTGHS